MPTRRIDDNAASAYKRRPVCKHPEHNPPSMMVFTPGVYEHECPACGDVITFMVPERGHLSMR